MNFIIPIDEVIFFRGVAKNHQPETQLMELMELMELTMMFTIPYEMLGQ